VARWRQTQHPTVLTGQQGFQREFYFIFVTLYICYYLLNCIVSQTALLHETIHDKSLKKIANCRTVHSSSVKEIAAKKNMPCKITFLPVNQFLKTICLAIGGTQRHFCRKLSQR
jgi:hypothetical protein